MDTVPTIISTKDLAYLADMFEWNFGVAKLANHFKEENTNPEVEAIITRVSEMHRNHCQMLDTILGGGTSEF